MSFWSIVDIFLWVGLGVSIVLFLYYVVREPILVNGYVIDIGGGLFRRGGGIIYSSDSYVDSANFVCKKRVFKIGRATRNYTDDGHGGEERSIGGGYK